MKKPIPVLHLLNASGGGAAQCAIELTRGLRSMNFQPFLVAPTLPSPSTLQLCASEGISWSTIPMGWWNRKNRLDWPRRIAFSLAQQKSTCANLITIRKLVQAIKEWNVQIVHTHTGLIPWGAIAAKLAGVKHVWHIHEPNGWRQPFSYWMPDFAYSKVVGELSDWLICVSNFVAEIFFQHPIRTPVEVVYQGIDVPKYSVGEGKSKLRRSLGVEENELLIGMVAGLSSTWKKHSLFVDIASQLSDKVPNAKFAIFGAIPGKEKGWLYSSSGEYAAAVGELVKEKRLSEKLLFAGFHADPPAVMKAIDILVHPCDVEGFGRVAIEAMAAGRPVVGPNRGGIAESVVDGVTGFLSEPDDVHKMAESCLRLINEPGLRKTMGGKGREHASRYFSKGEHIKRVAEIYERIL